MIINAGLRRFIGSRALGGYLVFLVEQWAGDWQGRDIIDDKQQYGQDMNVQIA